MLKIALTGNIAAGKSTVAEMWRDLGATVIEADELARRAVEPGTSALRRIVETWGPGILLPSGELDRAALRDIVFRDAAERARLEAIVHPEVYRLREIELERAEREGADLVVSDIPLLFEVGLEPKFDVVVLVDAPATVRKDRLTKLRGIDPLEADRMIASQLPSEVKRPKADFIIDNVGTLDDLRAEARRVWSILAARARGANDP